jgi:hypothetical protein
MIKICFVLLFVINVLNCSSTKVVYKRRTKKTWVWFNKKDVSFAVRRRVFQKSKIYKDQITYVDKNESSKDYYLKSKSKSKISRIRYFIKLDNYKLLKKSRRIKKPKIYLQGNSLILIWKNKRKFDVRAGLTRDVQKIKAIYKTKDKNYIVVELSHKYFQSGYLDAYSKKYFKYNSYVVFRKTDGDWEIEITVPGLDK